jgi:hypothetical protein
MAERPRLWGIDAVAAVYALATVLSLVLIEIGSPAIRVLAVLLAPLGAYLAIGIFFRKNPVRILLLVLLGIGLASDAILVTWHVVAMIRLPMSSSKDPLDAILNILIRVGASVVMLMYLCRPDVRDAFHRRKEPFQEP